MPVAIVGYIASAGVGGLVTATGSLTFAGNLLAGGIGLGISLGANAVLAEQPKAAKPADVKSTLRQSVLIRQKHYGMVRTGGGYVFYRSRANIFYAVVYLGEGPDDSFLEHYIDGRPAVPDGEEDRVTAKPFKGKLSISTRLGVATEAHFPLIAAELPEVYNVNFRGDGCVSVGLVARGTGPEDFASLYPDRIPQYESLRKAGIAFDPRDGVSRWTANLPLIWLAYLRDPDGSGIDASYFDEGDFAAFAAIGDQLLSTNGGGTVRRYHGQLSYDLATEPADINARMETATDGRLYLKSNGKIGVHPGIWVEPTIRIHDGCIVRYEMSDSSGPMREANEVTLAYTNPLAGYSEASCDPWRDEDDISAGGVKTLPIEAYEIQAHHHGRRVQKLKAARANARWQGTVVTDLWGIQARDERRIFLEIKDLGIDFQPFEIEDYQESDEDMTVILKVRSCSADMYNVTSAEEGTPPPIPLSTDDDDLDPPQNLVVVGGQRVVSGSNKVAIITATWDAYPDRDDLKAYATISRADQNDWQAMTVNESQTRAEAIGLVDGALYDVAVEWRKMGGTPSEQSIVENILSIADPVRPAAPTSFQAPVSGLAVSLSARAANDNTAYISFRRGTSTQSFAQATDITGDLRVTANQVIGFTDNPGVGSWRYWAVSKNGSGLAVVTPTGPIAVTVS